MNPQLVSLARIRTMTDAEMVEYAKAHSDRSILENELLKRLDAHVQHQKRQQRIDNLIVTRNPTVQGIVDWARKQEVAGS